MVFFNDPVPCPDPAERAVKIGDARSGGQADRGLAPRWLLNTASAVVGSLNDLAIMRQAVDESDRRPMVESEWRSRPVRDADTSTPVL
jgi:hypothetical protein